MYMVLLLNLSCYNRKGNIKYPIIRGFVLNFMLIMCLCTQQIKIVTIFFYFCVLLFFFLEQKFHKQFIISNKITKHYITFIFNRKIKVLPKNNNNKKKEFLSLLLMVNE